MKFYQVIDMMSKDKTVKFHRKIMNQMFVMKFRNWHQVKEKLRTVLYAFRACLASQFSTAKQYIKI